MCALDAKRPKKAVCLACFEEMTGDPGTCRKHIEAKHPGSAAARRIIDRKTSYNSKNKMVKESDYIVIHEPEAAGGAHGGRQPNLTSFRGFGKVSAEQRRQIHRLASAVSSRDNLADTWVEGEGVKELFEYISGGESHLPSRRTIGRHRKHMISILDKQMLLFFAAAKRRGMRIALAVDIWTSRAQHPFNGVVASFIDEGFNLWSVLLGSTWCATAEQAWLRARLLTWCGCTSTGIHACLRSTATPLSEPRRGLGTRRRRKRRC
jgi:hypothetical protein